MKKDEEKKKLMVRMPTETSVAASETLTPQAVIQQVALIQDVMKAAMKLDEHYGKIPGVKKMSLFKPGAEKLCLTFRMNPQYEEISAVEQDNFISYRIKCVLWHIVTGRQIASGMGTCNSKESKYQYRWINQQEKPTPEQAAPMKAAGTGKWQKYGDKWVWQLRAENENPWDQQNTIYKMACKRALVAAVLNGTAASDIFTQDVEDGGIQPQEKPAEKPRSVTIDTFDRTPKPVEQKDQKRINDIIKKAIDLGVKPIEFEAHCQKEYGKTNLADLTDEELTTLEAKLVTYELKTHKLKKGKK